MKITVKTVRGQGSQVDIEETATVGDLKKIIGERDNVDASLVSFVFKSKMLKDDAATVASYGVKDGDQVVLVLKKSAVHTAAPAAQPAAPAQAAPVQQQTAPVAQPAQPAAPAQPSQPLNQPVDIFQQQPGQQQQPAAQAPVEPSEEDILELVNMGFDREDVKKALRKTHNNLNIAANILLSGADIDSIPDLPENGAAGQDPFDLPKEQFIQLYNEQPDLFEPLFQKIEQTMPQLAGPMRQNPGMLYDLIQQSKAAHAGGQIPQHAPQPAPQPVPQQQPAGAESQMSAEDNAAVDRLASMGFSRAQCLQAYIACDKNEELAANFLLDHGFD